MVTELTQEQIAALPMMRDEFIARGLSTKQYAEVTPELRAKFEKLYECGGLKAPNDIFLVDSPLAVINKYKELTGESAFNFDDFAYGSLDAGWVSYYETFRRHAPAVKGLEVIAGLEGLVGEVSYYAPFEECVIASRNPVEICMVDGRLHNTTGPAWRYADGFCGFSLFGVEVSEEIIERVKAKDAAGILRINNVEQRLVALRAVGAKAALEALEAVEVDSYEHWYREGTLRADLKETVLTGMGFTKEEAEKPEYTLYAVKVEGTPRRILAMRNPSEPKFHYEWVTAGCDTVEEAMRVRMPAAVQPDGSFKWPGVKA